MGLGVGLAYLFAVAAILFPGLFTPACREHDGAVGTYFEAAAVIVTLVTLGDFQAVKLQLSMAPFLTPVKRGRTGGP